MFRENRYNKNIEYLDELDGVGIDADAVKVLLTLATAFTSRPCLVGFVDNVLH